MSLGRECNFLNCDLGRCLWAVNVGDSRAVLCRGGVAVDLTSDHRPSRADERNQSGVRLCTMHRAKGLEFHSVAIPFLSKTGFPPVQALRAAVDEIDLRNIIQQQKSLIHVAATRAKRVLRVSWSGNPSSLLTTEGTIFKKSP